MENNAIANALYICIYIVFEKIGCRCGGTHLMSSSELRFSQPHIREFSYLTIAKLSTTGFFKTLVLFSPRGA